MLDNGFFGTLFDFDGDGKLNDLEKAADFGAFMNLVQEDEKEEGENEDEA